MPDPMSDSLSDPVSDSVSGPVAAPQTQAAAQTGVAVEPAVAALRITLRQDATIGGVPNGGQQRSTLPYLPGQVVRGAFAAAWIRENGKPTSTKRAEFEALFEGEVTFRPLFKGAAPTSMAILKPKRGNEEPIDEAMDSIDERDDKYRAWEYAKGTLLSGERPSQLVSMHTELEHDETAKKSSLFGRQRIDAKPDADPGASVVFSGHLIGPETHLRELAKLTRLKLGGAKSVQGGADAEVEILPDLPRCWEWASDDQRAAVLRLASPAIFVDQFGRPSDRPPRSWLVKELREKTVQIKKVWPPVPRWVEEGGFHAASGLPKPVDLAVSAGTTYRIEARQPLTETALDGLARVGLGLRCHEGYGALAVVLAKQPPDLVAKEIDPLLSLGSATRRALADAVDQLLAEEAAGAKPATTLHKLAVSTRAPSGVLDAARWLLRASPADLSRAAELLRGADHG